MIETIFIVAAYLSGFFLAYQMNRVEISAEKEKYTRGGRLVNYGLSVFSWVTVLYLAFAAWFSKINKTGYWDEPVKPEEVIPETEKEASK